MADYFANQGNQEILSKYLVPLSSAMFSKQLTHVVEPGLCVVPVVGYKNKSTQYAGLDGSVVRLGPLSLFQYGVDPSTGQGMLFKVTTSEAVEVRCSASTVAIGYRYVYDPRDPGAADTFGVFSALSLDGLGSYGNGVIVCLVEMGANLSVVRADSRFADLSNNLLRKRGFFDDAGLSIARPGFSGGVMKTTVFLRKGNAFASDLEEGILDVGAGLVKRRVLQGWHSFGGKPAGVYVLGCVVSGSSVGTGPLPLVCSSGGVDWFAQVVGGNMKAALEGALQKVPFNVVVFGAVYWDGASLLTSEFFNIKRSFASVIKRVQDVLSETKTLIEAVEKRVVVVESDAWSHLYRGTETDAKAASMLGVNEDALVFFPEPD